MSGMEPMLIGAALGGVSSAAMGKNPIQGALLGGLSGGVFGAASAAGSAATGTGIGAAGSTVPGVMGAAPAMLPGAALNTGASGILNTTLPSMIPNVANPALSTATMATPFNVAATAPASFMQTMQNIPSALKQGIMENPSYALQGANAAQGLLTPEPMPQAPMGQVQRGQPMAPVNFAALLSPQQYKPQPISLLG